MSCTPPPKTLLPATVDALMQRYAAGDLSAFPALHAVLRPWLERHLRRTLRCHASVEDVLQATFLRMHAARSRYLSGSPVGPWLLVIARRLAIDHLRRTRVMVGDEVLVQWESDEPSPEAWFVAGELRGLMQQGLAELPQSHREAITLTRLEGLDSASAASALETTVMAVRLRVFRATGALRQRLDAPRRGPQTPRYDRRGAPRDTAPRCVA